MFFLRGLGARVCLRDLGLANNVCSLWSLLAPVSYIFLAPFLLEMNMGHR